jgi:hypothetical protein
MIQSVLPGLDDWEPWRPADIAARFQGIDRAWCVAGGWALDLWHGRQTRIHDDLECTVLREDLSRFQSELQDLEFYAAKSGELFNAPILEDAHQFWGLDPNRGKWRVDLMIEPGSDDTWVFKRDHSIQLPREEMVRLSSDGIPYLCPVAVLLFKAKYKRDKDKRDFDLALPRLSSQEVLQLKSLLERVAQAPDWIERLRQMQDLFPRS